jgi:hypothetical protein
MALSVLLCAFIIGSLSAGFVSIRFFISSI